MTDSFVEPNKDNFGSLIIKNGSPTSDKIKELIETTSSWLKTETVESIDPKDSTQISQTQENEVDSLSDNDPIAF